MRASLLAASLCLLPLLAVADPTVPQLMAQGQRAYIAGDYETAKEAFGEVLEIDLHNVLAVQFLRKIRLGQAAMGSPTPKPIDSLLIPKINFTNATFTSALDYLKQAAAKQNVTVSFVPQLPPAQLNRTITLNLDNIPFYDALTYLCKLDGATYKVDPYAIEILPAAPNP